VNFAMNEAVVRLIMKQPYIRAAKVWAVIVIAQHGDGAQPSLP